MALEHEHWWSLLWCCELGELLVVLLGCRVALLVCELLLLVVCKRGEQGLPQTVDSKLLTRIVETLHLAQLLLHRFMVLPLLVAGFLNRQGPFGFDQLPRRLLQLLLLLLLPPLLLRVLVLLHPRFLPLLQILLPPLLLQLLLPLHPRFIPLLRVLLLQLLLPLRPRVLPLLPQLLPEFLNVLLPLPLPLTRLLLLEGLLEGLRLAALAAGRGLARLGCGSPLTLPATLSLVRGGEAPQNLQLRAHLLDLLEGEIPVLEARLQVVEGSRVTTTSTVRLLPMQDIRTSR